NGGIVASAGNANGGSGGGTIEPPPIPLDGLELWLRADQGVTQSDGSVSIWRDFSGKKRDALQTAVNARPKLRTNALGGKPALVFDGADDYFKVPTIDADFSGGTSIFVVHQQAEIHTCDPYFEASNGSETDDIHLGDYKNSIVFEVEENTVN